MTDTPSTAPGESLLTDILLRLYIAVAILFFAAVAFKNWQADQERLTLLLLVIIETITAAIVICSRQAQRRDWRPLSVAASCIAMFYFLALDLDPARHLIPETYAVGLQVTGMFLQLYAKLSLGRSFGVLPATRRLVTTGAYRWLRHPIYFGYLVAHLGFLLGNGSLQNLAVLVVLYAAQTLRIQREEEMLGDFPGYDDYRSRVRYRIIPLVY
jgi:protein-S-isoprenylcysteine O-methyltransferase Ste14